MLTSYPNIKSFTLMELMTVLVIVSVIVSLTLPNFRKTVERAYSRDATNNLLAIHSANEIYRSENLQYWPTSGGAKNLTNAAPEGINASLGLSIVPNGFDYVCAKNVSDYLCSACRPNCTSPSYSLGVTSAPIGPGNPFCAFGSCP